MSDILTGCLSPFPSPYDVDDDHFCDVLPIFVVTKMVSIENGDIRCGSLVPKNFEA